MDERATAEPADGPAPVTPQTIAWRFSQAGLAPPPVPEAFAPRLKAYGEWIFATIDPPARPYDVFHYLEQQAGDGEGDYLLIAHDGHGMNSWALHYFLVSGPLVCFLQLPWGGVLTDEAAAAERIAAAFKHVAALCAAPLPANETLTVIDIFDFQLWTRAREGEELVAEETLDPLSAAVRGIAAAEPAADTGSSFV